MVIMVPLLSDLSQKKHFLCIDHLTVFLKENWLCFHQLFKICVQLVYLIDSILLSNVQKSGKINQDNIPVSAREILQTPNNLSAIYNF